MVETDRTEVREGAHEIRAELTARTDDENSHRRAYRTAAASGENF